MSHLSERQTALMHITEAPGLACDAVLTDEDGYLLCMSGWGRDTAIQEFRSRLTLSAADGGLAAMAVMEMMAGPGENAKSRVVKIRNRDELQNRSTRIQTELYGQQVNLWIYEAAVAEPDMANRHAVMLYQNPAEMVRSRWMMLKQLCHLPLLDEWEATVTEAFEKDELIRYREGLGLHAALFDLETERVEQRISTLLRASALPLP